MNETKEQTFLEKVKAGHPIQTRHGTPAKFVAHVPEAKEPHRLVVLCDGWLRATQEDGRIHESGESQSDIILAPKPRVKREGWVAVGNRFGNDCEMRVCSSVYPSKSECASCYPYRNVVHIEWEEEAP